MENKLRKEAAHTQGGQQEIRASSEGQGRCRQAGGGCPISTCTVTVVRAVRYLPNTEGSKDCFMAVMSKGMDEDWLGFGRREGCLPGVNRAAKQNRGDGE